MPLEQYSLNGGGRAFSMGPLHVTRADPQTLLQGFQLPEEAL